MVMQFIRNQDRFALGSTRFTAFLAPERPTSSKTARPKTIPKWGNAEGREWPNRPSLFVLEGGVDCLNKTAVDKPAGSDKTSMNDREKCHKASNRVGKGFLTR